MEKYLRLVCYYLLVAFLVVPVSAKLGVGIGTGKIQVDEKLKSGVIYNLPPVTVFNTGTEAAKYTLSVEYSVNQPELRPEKEWFVFKPDTFDLEPGTAQTVQMKLNLPLKTVPGDYFAYIQGQPITVTEAGVTAINIAAATKLYFTITPANFIQGVYYRLLSLWRETQPWSLRITLLLSVLSISYLLKKNLNIEISSKSKRGKKPRDKISSLT